MSHASKSGVCHVHRRPTTKSCLDDVRYLLVVPARRTTSRSRRSSARRRPRAAVPGAAATCIPASPNMPYDMHKVIAAVVDDGEFFEYFPPLGARTSCAASPASTAAPSASSATSRWSLAGVLDIESSEKAARFVRTCDAFNIPLVTFVDVPGFLPGVDQEHGGIIRHGAKLLYAYCRVDRCRASRSITRKAYGGAYVGDELEVDRRRPGASPGRRPSCAVMGPQGAVEIVYRRELQQAADPIARRAELVDEYTERFANPCQAAERGIVDDVIDPAGRGSSSSLPSDSTKHVCVTLALP